MKNKTVLTADFLKDIIKDFFNGNLDEVGKPYVNKNSEEIEIRNLDTGEVKSEDLARYLNIGFYTWQKKVDDTEDDLSESVDAWLDSIENSMNDSYARVSIENESCTASRDIDNGEITGNIEFLIQLNKVSNLDYYIKKLRNKYMGEPIEITNFFGNKIKAYFLLGIATSEEEPFNCQLGYCTIINCAFKVSYMEIANDYNDYKVEFSLDNGKNYYDIPLNKQTWKCISENTPVAVFDRPERTGFVVTTYAGAKTISFFDFNRKFNELIDSLMMRIPAYRANGLFTQRDTNLQHKILTRILVKGQDLYEYCDVIDSIEKEVDNGQFNICSISLKTAARQPLFSRTQYFAPIQGGKGQDMTLVPFSYGHFVDIDVKNDGFYILLSGRQIMTNAIQLTKETKGRMFLYLTTTEDCKVTFKTVISVNFPTGYQVEKRFIRELKKDRINYIELDSDYINTMVGWESEVVPAGNIIKYEILGDLIETASGADSCHIDAVSDGNRTCGVDIFD